MLENPTRHGLGYLSDRALVERPDAVAILQSEHAITYAELDRRCNQIAHALDALGVGRGDRVALLFDNDYRYVEAYLGTMRLGAVAVPINPRLADASVAFILAHSDARVLIASPNETARAQRLAGDIDAIATIVGFGAADGTRTRDFATWTAAASSAAPGVRVDDDALAFQPYTSGSTGRPKGVLLTHGGQLWNIDAMIDARRYERGSRAMTAAPLSHKNAMVSSIKPMLRTGNSVAILPRFTAEEYLAGIARYRPTYITGVPAMYNLLFAHPERFANVDVSSVRFATVGSSSVSPEVIASIRRHFNDAPVSESYGSTEGGPVSLIQPRDHSDGLLPVRGTELRVVREDGTDANDGEIGELLVRNPGILVAYYKDPQATAERLRDGWYHTRDFVRRSPNGRYTIIGRTDDMIITAAENVYPKEVEDVLRRHPAVADAVVVPQHSAIKGQVPVAFVVPRPGERTDEAELKAFFLANGPAFAHPRRVWFLDALPLSGPGKIDRRALREHADAQVPA